jgi:hypothetical protein
VSNVLEIRDGSKLYIVAGDWMKEPKVKFLRLALSSSNILTITPSATIYSFHPSLTSTTLGIYLSRIMIDCQIMAF